MDEDEDEPKMAPSDDENTLKRRRKKKPKVVRDDDDSDDEEVVMDDGDGAKAGWQEAYKARQAMEEARKAKEAAEAAAAEAAAKAAAQAAARARIEAEIARARAEAEAAVAREKAEAEAAAKAAEEAAAAAERAALVERYRQAQEAAAAKKAAEEAAAAEAAAAAAEGEDDDDVVEITEEEQAAEARLVTVSQAYAAFATAWNQVDRTQLYNDVQACGDDEAKMEALFPRVTDLKQIPERGARITAGPIRFAVYRYNKKSITGPQLKAMPGCQRLLEKIDNFYFHSPDAVFAGGGDFRAFLQSGTGRFASWFVDVKDRSGYRSTYQNLQFDGHAKAWKIPCTFVTHIPQKFNPPDPNCKLVKVGGNWGQALRYLRAAEAANAALNAGHGVPAMLQMRDGPRDKKVGVIGYDTPLDVPEWAKALLPKIKTWSDSNFPKLTEARATVFGRGGQRCTVAERVLLEFVNLHAKGFDLFKGVVTHQFTDKNTYWFKDFMDPASTKFVGLAAWGNHARIVYKNTETKTITIYDPWKQAVRIPQWMQEIASEQGYTSKFENRDPDQTPEGSCQLQATMRVLMAAVHGQDAILQKLDVDDAPHLLIYPVVTQLIYSKFRQRKR